MFDERLIDTSNRKPFQPAPRATRLLAAVAISARRFWKTATMAAFAYIGDSPWFPLDYLLRLVRVAVLLSIWRLILQDRGSVSGLSLATVLTYTLISE